MSAYRTRQNTVRYGSRILALLACMVAVLAAGGLSLVWLRQQITDTAARIQVTQRERVRVERRLEYLHARIAESHRPDVLHAQAVAMGLALRRPESRQIVRLGPLGPEGERPGEPAMPMVRRVEVSGMELDLASAESFSRRYGN